MGSTCTMQIPNETHGPQPLKKWQKSLLTVNSQSVCMWCCEKVHNSRTGPEFRG